jgi:hypothetical protein
VAEIVFVYYGSTRIVDERQALFLAEQLSRRALFSPAAGQLAQRIRQETGGHGEKESVRIELDEEDKEDLLVVLGQGDLDSISTASCATSGRCCAASGGQASRSRRRPSNRMNAGGPAKGAPEPTGGRGHRRA